MLRRLFRPWRFRLFPRPFMRLRTRRAVRRQVARRAVRRF